MRGWVSFLSMPKYEPQTAVPKFLIRPEIQVDTYVFAPIFFKRGNLCSFHSRIASSSRSCDLRSGRCGVNPKDSTICHVQVWLNDFPVTRLITAPMRSRVQRSVSYPNFLAPRSIARLTFFRSPSVSWEENPGGPFERNPRIPCFFQT